MSLGLSRDVSDPPLSKMTNYSVLYDNQKSCSLPKCNVWCQIYDTSINRLCHSFCRNADQRDKTLWASMMWLRNVSMATAWAAVSTGTCLPPATRTSQQEPRGAPLCREVSPCLSRIQHQRLTWRQRLPSLLSPSTPPPSQHPTYQRPTTSHAKRSMPKKLGRARNPPRHYSSDPFAQAADSQVTSRNIRDSDLTSVNHCFLFHLSCYASSKKGHLTVLLQPVASHSRHCSH